MRHLILLAVLIALFPAAPAHATATDCTFTDSFAMRSGALPYAGTLDEQVAASMENVYATSESFNISYRGTIGGQPSVSITTKHADGSIDKILYVNYDDHSYQFNLSAQKATYAKQRRNLATLLRTPFGRQAILCQ